MAAQDFRSVAIAARAEGFPLVELSPCDLWLVETQAQEEQEAPAEEEPEIPAVLALELGPGTPVVTVYM